MLEAAATAHLASEVSPGIWQIRLPLPFPVGVLNAYLLRSSDGFLLLDCGLKTRACRAALALALEMLRVPWKEIRRLVISHVHPDHFGLAAEVRELSGAEILMHPAEAALVAPRGDDWLAPDGAWFKENGVPPDDLEEMLQTWIGVAEFFDPIEPDCLLHDGDRLPVEGGELEVICSPGHAPGLLVFYFAARRLLFSSDHIVEKITPNIGLHARTAGNPLGQYLASLDRLLPLEIDALLPSHGHVFRGHREWIAATAEHHRQRCERMRATLDAAPRTAHEVALAEWRNHLSPLNQRFAVAEALAHLEYLRQQGRVATVRTDGLLRWRKTS